MSEEQRKQSEEREARVNTNLRLFSGEAKVASGARVRVNYETEVLPTTNERSENAFVQIDGRAGTIFFLFFF